MHLSQIPESHAKKSQGLAVLDKDQDVKIEGTEVEFPAD